MKTNSLINKIYSLSDRDIHKLNFIIFIPSKQFGNKILVKFCPPEAPWRSLAERSEATARRRNKIWDI